MESMSKILVGAHDKHFSGCDFSMIPHLESTYTVSLTVHAKLCHLVNLWKSHWTLEDLTKHWIWKTTIVTKTNYSLTLHKSGNCLLYQNWRK